MAINTKITLYDIPTTLPNKLPVSPFTTLVRYALNYKQLSFSTSWTDFANVKADALAAGAKPTSVLPDGTPRYTVPFIVDSTSGTPIVVSDSLAIVQYLDTTYPDPAHQLLEPSPRNLAVHSLGKIALETCVGPLVVPMMLPRIVEILTSEESKAILRGRLPPGFQEVKVDSAEGKAIVDASKEKLEGIAKTFGEQKWFGGDKPAYVDFALLGYLHLIRHVNEDVWKALKEVDGGRFEKMVEAGAEWAKLD